MTIIHLHRPDDLADKISRITGNAEALIIDLLRSKVNGLDAPKSLADEYRLAAAESTSLMKDFANIDNEGWDEEY